MHLFRFRSRGRSRAEPRLGPEVVRLQGDLDVRSAAATGRRLVELINTGPDVLEVDLAEVPHVSPDGCAALFKALRAARARGTRLIITHPNDRAQAVMRQIGLTRALTHRDAGTE
ncbi:STAS domain-containing protein [Streptomyces cavernae]|uniref:STAS domain-containing protein n=1 Tax=Streptomyces cavernae TaxID=2259034 RepID=UPI001390B20E|nr:STAS domain-containing protein [Streptomyces cavernae]